MHMSDEQSELVWGARVNTQWRYASGDCPSWAKPRQREKWDERGLVIWDHEVEQITWLSPTTTLNLLEQLRATEEWRRHGLVLGEPATQIWLNQPERKPERCLMDEMSLSPQRLQVVLEVLERHEESLVKLSEAQEADRRWRIARAYSIILDYRGHHGDIEQKDTENDE